MPNKATFTIKPIAQLLKEEMDNGIWLDPPLLVKAVPHR